MNACRTLERQNIIKQKEQEKRQFRFPITIPSSYTMSRDVKPSDTEGLEIEPGDVDTEVRHTRDAGFLKLLCHKAELNGSMQNKTKDKVHF